MKINTMKKDDIVTVRINEINNLGSGVGKLEDSGIVIFINGAITGELVEARLIKVNKSYCVGRLERIIEPSPFREDSFCSAPLSCGGCVYRHVSREHELELKKNYVKHAFIKVGLSDVDVTDVLHLPARSLYRNKAQYPIGSSKNGVVSGFYAAKTHKIVPCDVCSLQPKIFSDIQRTFCSFATEKGLTVYDEECGRGLLRHLYLRSASATGEIMLCAVINGDSIPFEGEFAEKMTADFPQIKSIMLNINKKNTNVVLGDEYRLVYGSPYITDVLCGKKFRISPGSFYQVNRDGAELLYGTAARLADFKGDETVLDLYCGIGTIGLSMSDKVGEIIGIEIVPEAVECAKKNAEINGIDNAEFYCGDASSAPALLSEASRARGGLRPDAVILDPPRKGSTPELIGYLSELNVPKIIYISCDPDTLARDCVLFRESGYSVGTVTPVDMFPATGHVETVVLLSRQFNLHKMMLNPVPFQMIKSGEKTIELRLLDEKRRKIKVGDRIVFTDNETGETLDTTVTDLHLFDSFDELYKSLPLLKCGYTAENLDKADPADMDRYYSVDEQNKYGVIGIELCKITPPSSKL